RLAARSLGVGTRSDLADYHRLKNEQFDAVIEDCGLVPVRVEGWGKRAWADPEALESSPRGRHRTTLLSPFDSLIWERARAERLFGFSHRLEAYVPKPKRV
ncbi:winged helix-turn-helix domain-containing protein, partial [Streptomyces sp. SID11233]|nr:winged helix-turn-helix domain-containing protein [Streptomyces sp. SID11233]